MFSSKRQAKQITELVSSALETNLNKTRHKIAVKAGFSSFETLQSTLPDDKPTVPTLKTYIERFPRNYLSGITKFDWATLEFGRLTELEITCTKDIQLLFQGFGFKNDNWLDKKFFFADLPIMIDNYGDSANEGVSLFETTMVPVDHNYVSVCKAKLAELGYEDKGSEHFYATLVQRLEPTLVVDNVEALSGNRDLCEDLIKFGTVAQYNFFCDNPKIVLDHNLKSELMMRYLMELFYSSGYREALCESFGHEREVFYKFLPLDPLMDTYSEDYTFENLKTPPPSLTDALTVQACLQSATHDLVSFVRNVLPVDETHYYARLMGNYKPESLYVKSHVPTATEASVLRHAEWFAGVLAGALKVGLVYPSDCCNNTPELLFKILSETKVPLDHNAVKDALSHRIPSGFYRNEFWALSGLSVKPTSYLMVGGGYDYENTEQCWFDLPTVAWLALNVCHDLMHNHKLNKNVNYLLSNLPKELLDIEFDLQEVFYADELESGDVEAELIKFHTARSMMVYAIKATKIH
ncbi:hypothetical protein [Vibrio crassostreae]|uniref:hypothetical protein n=1 Tax=Vibrio crassostreae TaxID=246167 RepID=UPI001B312C6D|nr:hypothetical protein [Vibrio crassostreae]